MTTATDIEVYLAGITFHEVEAWLKPIFDAVESLPKKKGMPKGATPLSLYWNNQQIQAIVFEDVEPGYTSIWFNSAELPWHNDEQCALAASSYFKCAVRITAGSWDNSADPDAWYEITADGCKTAVTWSLS